MTIATFAIQSIRGNEFSEIFNIITKVKVYDCDYVYWLLVSGLELGGYVAVIKVWVADVVLAKQRRNKCLSFCLV